MRIYTDRPYLWSRHHWPLEDPEVTVACNDVPVFKVASEEQAEELIAALRVTDAAPIGIEPLPENPDYESKG